MNFKIGNLVRELELNYLKRLSENVRNSERKLLRVLRTNDREHLEEVFWGKSSNF